ncbi:hypothetical protein [Luteimonas notoginsengisoli]|uniref:Integrase n=1 Tax=Luteimonas notoginsengisoli TaxID=1578200 RepID=A0ABV7UQR4_9GAMM
MGRHKGHPAIEAIAELSDADLRERVRHLSKAVPYLQTQLAFARREQRRRRRREAAKA